MPHQSSKKWTLLAALVPTLILMGCNRRVPLPSSYPAPTPEADQQFMDIIQNAIDAGQDINHFMYNDPNPYAKEKKSILVAVTERGLHRSLRMLLEKGFDIQSSDIGIAALMVCYQYGYLDCAIVLINHGVLKNKKDKEDFFLYRACFASKYRREFVCMLIGAGIHDFDQFGEGGGTLLGNIVYYNHYDVAELLVQCGADINIKDLNTQATPLHICAKYGKPEIAELLLKYGADVNAKDNTGRTPLDIAVESGDPDHESISGKRKVAKILQKYGGQNRG
jgi:ankyrin repeat protein